ncbi:cell division protein [uncultured Clostridium sp.]|uniref:cell division protein n=1 Tax=uncultured Clostridium sp. TaxID=59620 RepID=UPI0028E80A5B|nr:cell division protein [uncultured Clostridium sp.]
MKNPKLLNFIPLLVTTPVIVIGAIAMKYNNISTFIWGQNLACLMLMGLISYLILLGNVNIARSNFNKTFILIPVILLFLTFIGADMMGVHRWISIGPIRFNVSMIVMPITIILLWELLENEVWWQSVIITFAISILLFIQPDASQLTGFAVPMMIILCKKTDRNGLRTIIIGGLSILVVLSWIYLDGLPAVSYVERILSLVTNMGQMWLILGAISLVMLPMPFILFPPKNLKLPSICVGLYFMIIILSTFFGNFPVPLMGYGVSPIIGYIIPITWYVKSKINQ